MSRRSADVTGHAVLDFVQSRKYPDADEVISASIDADGLSSLRKGLEAARQSAELEVRSISREVASDVDEWIRRAKELQIDIENSRVLAREVVAQATEADQLHSKHIDTLEKAKLLREETVFNSSLQDSIEQIRTAAGQFKDAQSLAQQGKVEASLHRLQELELGLEELNYMRNTNALELLRQRVEDLRGTLVQQANDLWSNAITVDRDANRLSVRNPTGSTIDDLVRICTALNLEKTNALRLARDLQSGVMMPLFAKTGAGASNVPQVEVSGVDLSITSTSSSSSCSSTGAIAVLDGLETIVHFLQQRLPSHICQILSKAILPPLVSRLESQELPESVPTTLDRITEFESLLTRVGVFTERLRHLGWTDISSLANWTSQAPKIWLSRRKESVINEVRELCAPKIIERKSVERVETQKVSRDEVIAGAAQATEESDDWNEDWDEEQPASPDNTRHAAEDHAQSSNANGNGHSHNNAVPQDDDDWGWDDQEQESQADGGHLNPAASRKPSQAPQTPRASGLRNAAPRKELTLRETYCITGIPDELLLVISRIIDDAANLATGKSSSSPIASAANALYSVPTLVVAAYRALAPAHYELLPGGLMFLYNDSTRLADELQTLSSALSDVNPSASTRLKLAGDIDSLTSSARRAYGRAMDGQRTIVRDLIDNAQGFADCTVQPYASSCDDAVSATIAHVRAIAAEWRGILSRSALLQSLGSVLASVVGKVILDIEEMSDIGDEESKQLRSYCLEICKLSDLFTEEGGGHGASGEDEVEDMTGLYTRDWSKFRYLIEILQSNLADIKWMWTETEGLRLDFEVEELVDLIEALFADNDHRRKAIAEIRR